MDVVHEVASLIDAHLVRITLEEAGIPEFVRSEALLGAWRIAGLRTVGRLRSRQLLAGGAGAVRLVAAVVPALVRSTLGARGASDVTLHAQLIR